MDLFSQDKELETIFQGAKNESTTEFLRRSFDNVCGIISNPKRMTYTTEDLHSKKYRQIFEVHERTLISNNVPLHCAVWSPLSKSDTIESIVSPLCLVYLHTNTRSTVDAKELLPLAEVLGAHVLAFDMPGAGQSGGAYVVSPLILSSHLQNVLEWATEGSLKSKEFVLWGRGMGTAIVLEYLKQQQLQEQQSMRVSSSWSSNALRTLMGTNSNNHGRKAGTLSPSNSSPNLSQLHGSTTTTITTSKIKFCVLDSPYTSVRDIFDTMADNIKSKSSSFSVTSPLINAGGWLMRCAVSNRLGTNVDSIISINHASVITTPVLIMSANRDDYIPASHGERFRSSWGGSYAQYHVFEGGHFGDRTEGTVLMASHHIQQFVTPTRCGISTHDHRDNHTSSTWSTKSDVSDFISPSSSSSSSSIPLDALTIEEKAGSNVDSNNK